MVVALNGNEIMDRGNYGHGHNQPDLVVVGTMDTTTTTTTTLCLDQSRTSTAVVTIAKDK